jgi:mRNA interferase MazF
MGNDYTEGLEMSFPLRGDVYWIDLDPTVGAEIQKTRPGVIISPDAANKSGPLVIVAPITKVVRGKIHFHEILLPKGTAGLQFESKIKVFQLRCIDKKRLSESKIGSIPNKSIKKLDEKIRIVTGLY